MTATRRAGGRPLTPDEQVKVLARVWRNQRDGYVFLPWITGSSSSKAQRRKNYHEGRAFLWPKERGAILEHVRAHQEDDLYFCPNLFNGKRRQEELVYAEMCLYADLDAVDPRKLKIDRRPTIAWESSPGRFQGAWLLAGMKEGATWPGGENQRLTYELGADLSGWDATQLLRVPGKPNYKYEYKDKNRGQPAPGRLLWDNGPRYGWDDFDDLPEIGVVGGSEHDLMDEDLLAGIDRHEVWARVRMRCSARVRRHMAVRSADDVDGADRSDVIWEICRDLADAGCTLAEIVAVVRPTVWNKFVGRNDELRRLKTGAAKALSESGEAGGGGGGALEVVEEKPRTRTTISDLFREEIRRPKWLIKNIWPEGGCGFVAGEPKSYKSWIAMDMALSLTTGTPFLGEFPVVGGPHRVLYLQQEDSKPLVKDRLGTVIDGKSEKHHPHGLVTLDTVTDGTGRERWVPAWEPAVDMGLYAEVRSGFVASDEAWQSWLDEYVAETGVRMVVIDTLFTSAGNLDLDKATEVMNRMLRPLSAIGDKHNCAVAVVHHNKKNGSGGGGGSGDGGGTGRAGKDMLGSTAMHAWVDSALYVRSRREVPRVIGLETDSQGDGVGAGVPGVEVLVERETKVAEEIRFRVGIPRMSRTAGGDGEASGVYVDRWTPQVIMGWRSEKEGESSEGDGRERKNGYGAGDNGRRRLPPGRLMVDRMAEMGITAVRGRSVEDIAEVLDVGTRSVRLQLKAAVSEGWVKKDDRSGKWFLTAGSNGSGTGRVDGAG